MESAVLAFPLTPFDTAGDFAPDAFSAYLDYQLANGPGALFVACGTGEFSSLGTDDYEAVVRTAVQRVGGRLPVIAGAGYGARLAADFARAAERAGADGVLLLPPYLLSGPQAGLVEHTRAVAAATRLPVIAYQRNQVAYTPDSLAELAAGNRAPWQKAGELIARCHRGGLDHVDLNAHNILFDADGQGWVIDLDRCRKRLPETGWRARNLARLERSLLKLRGERPVEDVRTDFARLREAYDARWAKGY